ncbi:hypothetical protein GCM10010389_38420 [Streptomyces echinoruber]|uniref:Uncharacterized protein n=1 Tax=Streptomyces echinoruber TaxID=68898 RepID=A0A918RG84_9ACTN|nr:hypothetical protein GCM10010389_38420 [Streptomyces echinoruber]
MIDRPTEGGTPWQQGVPPSGVFPGAFAGARRQALGVTATDSVSPGRSLW